MFHYKPSNLGCPYFWKHPYTEFNEESIKASTAKTVAGSVDVSFLVGERGLPSWHPSSIPLEGGEVILQPILFKCDTETSIYGIYSYDCLCKYVRILTSITWKHTMRLLKISRQENVGDFSWVESWGVFNLPRFFLSPPAANGTTFTRLYWPFQSMIELPPWGCWDSYSYRLFQFGRLVHAPWFCLLHHRQPT